eukprot:ctg_1349.g253
MRLFPRRCWTTAAGSRRPTYHRAPLSCGGCGLEFEPAPPPAAVRAGSTALRVPWKANTTGYLALPDYAIARPALRCPDGQRPARALPEEKHPLAPGCPCCVGQAFEAGGNPDPRCSSEKAPPLNPSQPLLRSQQGERSTGGTRHLLPQHSQRQHAASHPPHLRVVTHAVHARSPDGTRACVSLCWPRNRNPVARAAWTEFLWTKSEDLENRELGHGRETNERHVPAHKTPRHKDDDRDLCGAAEAAEMKGHSAVWTDAALRAMRVWSRLTSGIGLRGGVSRPPL